MQDDDGSQDICRVCRCEAAPDRPLYHPCMCTGTIRFVHQDCLQQWLRYSKKEHCELCRHQFTFQNVFSADMPPHLPVRLLLTGVLSSIGRGVRLWLHYTLVAIAWLGIVPLTACRIYRCIFTGSVTSLLTSPWDMFSLDNILVDCLYGCFVVSLTLLMFVGYIWLREQIMHGGAGPDWFMIDARMGEGLPGQGGAEGQVPAGNARPAQPAEVFRAAGNNNQNVAFRGRRGAFFRWIFRNNNEVGLARRAAVNAVVRGVPGEPVDDNNRDNEGGNEQQPREAENVNNDMEQEEDQNDQELDEEPVQMLNNNRNNRMAAAIFDLDFERVFDFIGGVGNQNVEENGEQIAHENDNANEEQQGQNDEGQNNNPVVQELDNGQIMAGAVQPQVAGQQEVDWVAEELTWERLIGLDGSLVFLEHLFWVISLNTLFILVFDFCPYHIGHFAIIILRLTDIVQASRFEWTLTTLFGYLIVAVVLVIMHSVLKGKTLARFRTAAGLGYLIIKVGLLIVLELCCFPLLTGLWIDTCSLQLFNSTFTVRYVVFQRSPTTFVVIHWLIGMMYVFYFSSLITLLREILRPGVLWFMRNLNDPDFNPIRLMIRLSVYGHIRRLVSSLILFGSMIFIILWLPIRTLKRFLPSVLPYSMIFTQDSNLDFSLELILLQFVMPAIFEGRLKRWCRAFLRLICTSIARVLGIRSFLIGDVPLLMENNNNPDDLPYIKPPFFVARLIALGAFACLTLYICSLFAISVPVTIGRMICVYALQAENQVHDLVTVCLGGYVVYLIILVASNVPQYFKTQVKELANRVWTKFLCLLRYAVCILAIGGVIPLLVGLLLDLAIHVPLRIPLNETPVFNIYISWFFGILHTKVIMLTILIIPRPLRFRALIELIQNELLRPQGNVRLLVIFGCLMKPVVALLLMLTLPYVFAWSIAPLLGLKSHLVFRCIYPFLFSVFLILTFIKWHIVQFRRFYESIKNDKYLIGQRLVNYNPS